MGSVMVGRGLGNTIQIRDQSGDTSWFPRHLLPIAGALGIMLFLAIPVSLDTKSHAFLHGLCAQRPSHSYVVGGKLLPFDARMTGIYFGFLMTFLLLSVLGRHRSAGLPSVGAGVILLGLLCLMALDGFNSLFTDIGRWALYTPDNRIRTVTGFGAGVGLATILAMLFGMSLWSHPHTGDRILKRWWEPLALAAPGLLVAVAISNAPSLLYAPVALILIVSAVTVFSGLALVSMVLLLKRENTFDNSIQLQRSALVAVGGGVAAVLLLAAIRFALEAVTQAPPLT